MKKNSPQDIWKKINKKAKNKCWPYIGSTFFGRYGRFFINGKAVLAHRFLYQMINGLIPNNIMVMHKCNNKLCCNPDHLTTGDNRKNQMHAVYSGAWKVGKSGIRGVYYDNKRKYWAAGCYENGVRRNLYTGPFKTKAIKARKDWENINCIVFNTKGES